MCSRGTYTVENITISHNLKFTVGKIFATDLEPIVYRKLSKSRIRRDRRPGAPDRTALSISILQTLSAG